MRATAKKSTFGVILIKPTHYDDDGYPIPWLRSHIPSNTLAALYGLGEDCRQRGVFGPDVDIQIKPFDETNTRVRSDRIIADIRRNGGKALICLVGVQPTSSRAPSTSPGSSSRPGCRWRWAASMPPGACRCCRSCRRRSRRRMDMGVSMFAGEAEEGRLDTILLDAWNGTLKPLYNYMDDLPGHRGRADTQPAARPRWPAMRAASRASISAAAARSSARSAPSSTCRAARAASAVPTTSRRSSARTTAGHHVVLHHRRQHRPQQTLGGLLRPADRAQGERGHRGAP